MQKIEHYVNDIDAAKFLALKPQTLRNWRTLQRGPAYVKVGRAVRYDPADLRAYMERHRVSIGDN